MKAEFYFDKCQYTCSLSEVDCVKELRIRNSQGLVLAVKQGQTTGFLGKTRKNARQVDVSNLRFYNLIKAALSALELKQINQDLQEKEELLVSTKRILEQKERQIGILNQQISLLNQKNHRLSQERQQELNQLQEELKKRELDIQQRQQHIAQLEDRLTKNENALDLKEIETNLKTQLDEQTWLSITKSSRKELCDSYRQYQLIHSESFTASLSDYSVAGLGLCLVAEREILSPFFKKFYLFLKNSRSSNSELNPVFEVGGLTLKSKAKYTLGNLPPLLSFEWDNFSREALDYQTKPRGNCMYQTVFFGEKVSTSDRKLVKNFLRQWQHPLANWLLRGDLAASKIDQIRQLRNRATHHEDILCLWQFERLWLLVMGGKKYPGILREIYQG